MHLKRRFFDFQFQSLFVQYPLLHRVVSLPKLDPLPVSKEIIYPGQKYHFHKEIISVFGAQKFNTDTCVSSRTQAYANDALPLLADSCLYLCIVRWSTLPNCNIKSYAAIIKFNDRKVRLLHEILFFNYSLQRNHREPNSLTETIFYHIKQNVSEMRSNKKMRSKRHIIFQVFNKKYIKFFQKVKSHIRIMTWQARHKKMRSNKFLKIRDLHLVIQNDFYCELNWYKRHTWYRRCPISVLLPASTWPTMTKLTNGFFSCKNCFVLKYFIIYGFLKHFSKQFSFSLKIKTVTKGLKY